MEVSIMFDICTYCVFTLYGRVKEWDQFICRCHAMLWIRSTSFIISAAGSCLFCVPAKIKVLLNGQLCSITIPNNIQKKGLILLHSIRNQHCFLWSKFSRILQKHVSYNVNYMHGSFAQNKLDLVKLQTLITFCKLTETKCNECLYQFHWH